MDVGRWCEVITVGIWRPIRPRAEKKPTEQMPRLKLNEAAVRRFMRALIGCFGCCDSTPVNDITTPYVHM